MEVIAKKNTSLVKLYIFLVVVLSVTACVSLAFILDIRFEDVTDVILQAFAVVGHFTFTAFGIVVVARLNRVPVALITREDDMLCFQNGSCKISDISKVKRAPAKKANPKYGNISVYLGERKIIVRYVKNVAEAYDRLNKLIAESQKENPNFDKVN